MQTLLEHSDSLYKQEPCCHSDGRDCSCYNCLREGFYGPDPDTYSCLKKLCSYVLNYGPSYTSEIYNYLEHSKLIESNFANRTVNVISLGCGFGPDQIALSKYIQDNDLNVTLKYIGIDIEEKWKIISKQREPEFNIFNILDKPLTLKGFNIVFINKLFSTLKNQKLDTKFLDIFVKTMLPSLSAGSFIIFNDVNHRNMGRDQFDRTITPLVESVSRYFYRINNAYTGDYQAIVNTNNICDIPINLSVTPKWGVAQSVFFQYKK